MCSATLSVEATIKMFNLPKKGSYYKMNEQILYFFIVNPYSEGYSGRPRRLSWMRRPTGDQEVAGSTPVEVGMKCHEIFSTVILSLLLSQEGQFFSVFGERMCTILVNRLED